jgi:hypothetical protein
MGFFFGFDTVTGNYIILSLAAAGSFAINKYRDNNY